MAPCKVKVPTWSLLLAVYGLAVVFVLVLMIRQTKSESRSFSLSHLSTHREQGLTALSVHGESLHSGIRGLLAKNLVNEEALLWRQLAGIPVKAIDVSDNLALISCQTRTLVSIGTQDGQVLGSLELPDAINEIKIVGEQALVWLSRHSGFALVDIKDPKSLKLVRHYPVQGFVTSTVADHNIIYYTDLYQGVGRIDLSAENIAPEMLMLLDSPWRIALQGNKLAVGTTKGQVHLYDLNQDGRLSEAGSLNYQENVRGVAFVDDCLSIILGNGSLHVYDVSAWPRLSHASELKLSGNLLQLVRVPGQPRLAVSLAVGGMVLVDVARPEAPTLSGTLKMPKTFLALKLLAGKIFTTSREGMKVFSLDEISEGDSSSAATGALLNEGYYKLKSWNGHVYGYKDNNPVDYGEKFSAETGPLNRFMAVADKFGVGLYERGENGRMQRAGSVVVLDGTNAARYRDGFLYVLFADGLRIFNGTRPEGLDVIGELTLPGLPRSFEILDSGYLLATTRDNGVLVVDINDPQKPLLVSILSIPPHLRTNTVVQDVFANGQRAYVSMGKGGVHVYDFSSPSQPVLLQVIDTPGYAQAMALYDKLLLVADGIDGLFMIDVNSEDQGALPIGSLPTPLRIDQIAVVKDGLIASSRLGGTMKLPLPERLKNLRFDNEGEMAFAIETAEKGQYLYLYDGTNAENIEVIPR